MCSSHRDGPSVRRVSPFGCLRFIACLRLPVAFRSLPRPSSALGARASTLCSYSLDHFRLRTANAYPVYPETNLPLSPPRRMDSPDAFTSFATGLTNLTCSLLPPPLLPCGFCFSGFRLSRLPLCGCQGACTPKGCFQDLAWPCILRCCSAEP